MQVTFHIDILCLAVQATFHIDILCLAVTNNENIIQKYANFGKRASTSTGPNWQELLKNLQHVCVSRSPFSIEKYNLKKRNYFHQKNN